jgi:hypothetical protein
MALSRTKPNSSSSRLRSKRADTHWEHRRNREVRVFLRFEVFGHYLELGQTSEPEEAEPVPEGTQFPMVVYSEPIGFRIIGDDGEISTDLRA